MTTKTVNYTPDQEAAIKAVFADGQPDKAALELFAASMGKSLRSIIAKASRMELYTSPAKAVAGKRAVKKEDLANTIAVKLGMVEADATSLTKANASALAMIVKALGD